MEFIEGRLSEDQVTRFSRFSLANQTFCSSQQNIAQSSDDDLGDVLKESINKLIATDAYGTRDEELDRARERCKKLLKGEVFGDIKRIGEREFCRKMSIDITKDFVSQKAFLGLVGNYEPEYLRLAVEALLGAKFDSILSFKKEFRSVGNKYLFTTPQLASNPKFAIGNVTKVYTEDGKSKAYVHFLVKTCQLMVLMDKLATERVILNITRMFTSKSSFTSTGDVIREFSKGFVPGSILLPKFFESVGFHFSFEQTPIHTYKYHVDDIFTSLNDGIILCRLVENIYFSKTGKLRLLAGISAEDERLRKIANIRTIVMQAKELELIPEDAKLNPNNIHAGEKYEILKLLCFLFGVNRNEEQINRTNTRTFVDWSTIRNNRPQPTLSTPFMDAKMLTSTPMYVNQRSPLKSFDMNESEIMPINKYQRDMDDFRPPSTIHEETQTSFNDDEFHKTTMKLFKCDENSMGKSIMFGEVNETVILRSDVDRPTVITKESQGSSYNLTGQKDHEQGVDPEIVERKVSDIEQNSDSTPIKSNIDQRISNLTLADELNEWKKSNENINQNNGLVEKNEDNNSGVIRTFTDEDPRVETLNSHGVEHVTNAENVVGPILDDEKEKECLSEECRMEGIQLEEEYQNEIYREQNCDVEVIDDIQDASIKEKNLPDDDAILSEVRDELNFSAELSKYLNQSKSLILGEEPLETRGNDSVTIVHNGEESCCNLSVVKEENSNDLTEYELNKVPHIATKVSDFHCDLSDSEHSFKIDSSENILTANQGETKDFEESIGQGSHQAEMGKPNDELCGNISCEAEETVEDSFRLLTFNEVSILETSNMKRLRSVPYTNIFDEQNLTSSSSTNRELASSRASLLNEINSEFMKIDSTSTLKNTSAPILSKATESDDDINTFERGENDSNCAVDVNSLQMATKPEIREVSLSAESMDSSAFSEKTTKKLLAQVQFEMRMATNNMLIADTLTGILKKNMPRKHLKYTAEQAATIIQSWWKGVHFRRSNFTFIRELEEKMGEAKERVGDQFDMKHHRPMTLLTRVTKYIPMFVSSSLYERVVAASFMNRIIEDYPAIIEVFVERSGITAVVESSNLLIRSSADIIVQKQLSKLINNIVLKSELVTIEGEVVGLTKLLVKHLKKYRPQSSVVDREVAEIFKMTSSSLFRLSESSAAVEVMRTYRVKYYIDKVIDIRFPTDDFGNSCFKLRQVMRKIETETN